MGILSVVFSVWIVARAQTSVSPKRAVALGFGQAVVAVVVARAIGLLITGLWLGEWYYVQFWVGYNTLDVVRIVVAGTISTTGWLAATFGLLAAATAGISARKARMSPQHIDTYRMQAALGAMLVLIGLAAGAWGFWRAPKREFQPKLNDLLADTAQPAEGLSFGDIEHLVDKQPNPSPSPTGDTPVPIPTDRLNEQNSVALQQRQSGPATYTVKPGDTLGCIAEDYYGSYQHWPDIVAHNPQPNQQELKLFVGTQLILPKVEVLHPATEVCP